MHHPGPVYTASYPSDNSYSKLPTCVNLTVHHPGPVDYRYSAIINSDSKLPTCVNLTAHHPGPVYTASYPSDNSYSKLPTCVNLTVHHPGPVDSYLLTATANCPPASIKQRATLGLFTATASCRAVRSFLSRPFTSAPSDNRHLMVCTHKHQALAGLHTQTTTTGTWQSAHTQTTGTWSSAHTTITTGTQ